MSEPRTDRAGPSDPVAGTAPQRTGDRPAVPALAAAVALGALAAAFAAAELFFGLTDRGYGMFIDELYYLACARHLAWGFVDHPPLAPALLRLSTAVLGEGRLALRLLPALAGAATVALTGWLAGRFGAGLAGRLLAAAAVALAPLFLVIFGVFSMNAFELLLWLVLAVLLVEIEERDEPRLWLAFGAVAGIALLDKHTVVLLIAGLAVGLVATPARRHLGQRWLWLGAALALLIAAPNLAWQVTHGWPSIEFYRNADLYKNLPTPPLEELELQLFASNPGAAPLWLAGLAALLAGRRWRAWRHLGWAALALLALMVFSGKSRPDRIAGIYPLLFAAGAAGIEVWVRQRWSAAAARWAVAAVAAPLVAIGLWALPLGLPILPPPQLAAWLEARGLSFQIERGAGKTAALPQWFADRTGWPELVADVTAVVERLPPAERRRAVIFAQSYGQAGAVEALGHDLPPVYANQNTYFLWGPPPRPVTVAVVLGDHRERLEELFEEVEEARVHHCEWCMRWRDDMPIWIVRRPRRPIAELWPTFKHYE